jgi:hypothetical protein
MKVMAATILLSLTGTALADLGPSQTVDEMCNTADLVIEGTWDGNGAVKIEKVYKESNSAGSGEQVQVPALKRLSLHSRDWGLDGNEEAPLDPGIEAKPKPIPAKTAVLFLTRIGGTHEQWEPIGLCGTDNVVGSRGVFWLVGDEVFGYEQRMNPGPLSLCKGRAGDHPLTLWSIPPDGNSLRRLIGIGLRNSAQWRVAMAMTDPNAKAGALARFLLPRTLPTADTGTFPYRTGTELASLRGAGLKAVLAVLKDVRDGDPGLGVDTALIAATHVFQKLEGDGDTLSGAIPVLRRLAERPRQAYPRFLLEALKAAGDANAPALIAGLLKHADPNVRMDAAFALVTEKEVGYFDHIAAILPKEIKPDQAGHVARILCLLHELDPARAKAIIESVVDAPALRDYWRGIPGAREPRPPPGEDF